MQTPKSSILSAAPDPELLELATELGSLLRPSWASMSADLRLSGVPLNEGDDDEDAEAIKKERDELKNAIARKDKDARAEKKRADDLEEKLEGLERKLEAATGDDSDAAKLERRLQSAERKAEAAEKKATEAEEKRVKAERNAVAVSVATRLKFRNPAAAVRLLDDSDSLEDESDFERELEKLAQREPYMISSKKQRQVEDPKNRTDADDDDGDDDGDDDPKKKNGAGGDDGATGPERIKAAIAAAESKGKSKSSSGESED